MLKRVIFLGILQEITDLMVFILISFFDNDRKLNISPLKKRACWKNIFFRTGALQVKKGTILDFDIRMEDFISSDTWKRGL